MLTSSVLHHQLAFAADLPPSKPFLSSPAIAHSNEFSPKIPSHNSGRINIYKLLPQQPHCFDNHPKNNGGTHTNSPKSTKLRQECGYESFPHAAAYHT
jgi:hypothetical protein